MKENKPISLEELPQDKLKELIKKLSTIRKKKYIRYKEKRYGNLNWGFTEEELKKFFYWFKDLRTYLSFKLMALLGLKVGEVVKIKAGDIYFINFVVNN